MPAAASTPPLIPADAVLALPGGSIDLRGRVLVAGVVPPPRFGRENEVIATVEAIAASGADLVDVSHGPRMIGPAVRSTGRVVVARCASRAEARDAGRAGAGVLLVPPEALSDADENRSPEGWASDGGALVVVVDDMRELASVRRVADRTRIPLAFDSTRLNPRDALAAEAVAVVGGCRVLRTVDVRRGRRVATALGALWEARRG